MKTTPLNRTQKKRNSIIEFLNKDFSISGNRLSDQKKEKFYAQFSLLISSGLDIKTVLELIEGEDRGQVQKLVQYLKISLIKGKTLSDSMNDAGLFSPFEVFSIKIGEDTGQLHQVLQDLSSYYAKKVKQQRHVIQALSYPVIVISTVVGVLVFMLKVMVPMFTEMFKRFNGELPFITKAVIAGSELFGFYFPYLLLLILGSAILMYLKRGDTKYREITSRLILRLPLVGVLVKKVYLARFCHSMNLLLSARLPLITALDHVSNMISYYPIENAIQSMKVEIAKGASFKSCLAEHWIFEKRLISLVHVGEETNKLDEIFRKLNEQYQAEIEHQTSILVSLMEPLFILVLGLVVGVVLVSMYLPIFQMSTGIGG